MNVRPEPTRRRFLGTAVGLGATAAALSAAPRASAVAPQAPTPNPPGDEWPIAEPYPVLNGGVFSGPKARASDDPLVQYQWAETNASDGLQVYQLRPVAAVADTPGSFTGLETVTTPACNVVVNGTGSVRLDFGVESPAWLEFDSPDFSGAVEMSISEYNQPAVVNPGPANPVKTLAPVRYGNTFRLELNSELYEGLRFGWIHVNRFDRPWHITAVRAVAQVKPTNYTGSFQCSDDMLNRIWYTGAYCVKANLYTNYFGAILMDRSDRIAWAGDCHTAQAAALVAFDDWDFVRANFDQTVAGNGIASYELYWVQSLLDYYQHTGDMSAISEYSATTITKLEHANSIYDDPTIGFYGWDERLGAGFELPNIFEAKSAYRMLFIGTCRRFAAAMASVGDQATATTYSTLAAAKTAALKADPAWYQRLGVHALSDAVNAGVVSDDERAPIIEQEFSDRLNRLSYSPFNQYFVINALAALNRYDDALTTVRDSWGGQLEYGGTLYFEVFRPDWLTLWGPEDPRPYPPPNCQSGYTSLGHAWGAGVTAWLTHEILGIVPTAPGYTSVDVVPHLGKDLSWVHGSVKTPGGDVSASFDLRSGRCAVQVPPGSVARIGLPLASSQIRQVTVDEQLVWDGAFHPVAGVGAASADDEYVYLEQVQPGDRRIKIFYVREPVRSPAPLQPFHRPIRFAGEDVSTSGNWPGRYGSEGYVLFDYDTPSLGGANWIWYPEGAAGGATFPVETRYFRGNLDIPAGKTIKSAQLITTADDSYTVYVNGSQVSQGTNWQQAQLSDLTRVLQTGGNMIAASATNASASPAGFLATVAVQFTDGSTSSVVTDGSWKSSKGAAAGWQQPGFDDSAWAAALVEAPYGTGPWGGNVTVPSVNHQQLPVFVQSVALASTRASGNCVHNQWTSGTTDPRALAPDPGAVEGGVRNLGVVYTSRQPPTMTVDIATTPGQRYQLALYCLDWDRQDRKQGIEVFDLQTLKLAAPVRLVENFENGTYLIYECDRSVRLRFDQLKGDNAVLNAVFFDPISG